VKLKLDIRPDLVAMMRAEIAAGERAVSAAMREAGAALELAWRGQIVGAGLGPRLANSIRSEVFPKAGASLNAAAVVWSKAPVIVGAHDAGALIRWKNGSCRGVTLEDRPGPCNRADLPAGAAGQAAKAARSGARR
jgi:hypothetical protein